MLNIFHWSLGLAPNHSFQSIPQNLNTAEEIIKSSLCFCETLTRERIKSNKVRIHSSEKKLNTASYEIKQLQIMEPSNDSFYWENLLCSLEILPCEEIWLKWDKGIERLSTKALIDFIYFLERTQKTIDHQQIQRFLIKKK
jgi:hypothetical protein